ncbi:DUF2735 domain-containing protein [Mesorhizobium sp. ASY16-5R]|jgi:hypothetical protein|uniref:DUF2735 domain-containing protein n=1 Tax=Mesorhizobium sp. ASY16-5R TaxID=3445772 RepID=UPI003FA10F69
MTTTTQRESAKLYTFQPKGRAVTSQKASAAKPGRVVMMPRVASLAFDAWYHQAAIQEETVAKR